MTNNRRRLAAVIAVLVLVAACGGDDGETADTIATLETEAEDDMGGATGSGGDTTELEEAEAQVLEFAQCLRDEGLDVRDPSLNADGSVDFESMFDLEELDPFGEEAQAAFEVCTPLLEGLAFFPGGEQFDEQQFEDDLLAVAVCLREKGYDADDPPPLSELIAGGPGGGSPTAVFGEGFPLDDPDNIAVVEQCAEEVGFNVPGASTDNG